MTRNEVDNSSSMFGGMTFVNSPSIPPTSIVNDASSGFSFMTAPAATQDTFSQRQVDDAKLNASSLPEDSPLKLSK